MHVLWSRNKISPLISLISWREGYDKTHQNSGGPHRFTPYRGSRVNDQCNQRGGWLIRLSESLGTTCIIPEFLWWAPNDVIARVHCCPITMHVLLVNWVGVCVWGCNEFITLTIQQRLKKKEFSSIKPHMLTRIPQVSLFRTFINRKQSFIPSIHNCKKNVNNSGQVFKG